MSRTRGSAFSLRWMNALPAGCGRTRKIFPRLTRPVTTCVTLSMSNRPPPTVAWPV